MKTKRFRKWCAIFIPTLVIIFFFAGFLFAPNDPMKSNLLERYADPSAEYPFGTDALGRCILSRILYGGWTTLGIVLGGSLIVFLLGTVIGMVTSRAVMKENALIDGLINAVTAIPPIAYLIVFIGAWGSGAKTTLVALTVSYILRYIKLVRTRTDMEMGKAYVMCAIASGASKLRIMLIHIFPNLIAEMIRFLCLSCADMILAITGFSFIGLGLGDNVVDWGKPLGEMYMEEVTADDIRLALVPLSKKSEGLYNKVNMLLKCIFYAAERNQILEHNPCAGISGKGGKPSKKREALTDQQVAVLLDTVKGLPPYLFIMLGLYSGLRREEILALQWDCVFLDEDTPYLSVRRAWRTEHNRPVVSTVLKTPAAKRDIPIPKCLVDCLREAKENSISDYVIADSKGEPLAASQFQRVWQYVVVRSTKPRNYYKYVNGESIKYTVTPTLGMTQKNQPQIKYTLDFDVTPHQLRHTYITNLLYAGVDPKTVQYLAGHENSKTTMDIYAKVKYNKPEELFGVVNGAFHQVIAE